MKARENSLAALKLLLWLEEQTQDQAQDLVMKVVEIKRKSNSLPQQTSYAKIRTPTGKEWDPETWDRDIWVDSFENSQIPLSVLGI